MPKPVKINFKKELFCPMYWYAGEAMENPAIRFVFAYGGSSASKTYSIVQKIIVETLFKGVNTIVLRKYSSTIERSIYEDFKLVVQHWGLGDYFDFQQLKIKCTNGAKILFSGLDDPEKIKGIVGYTYAIMEEFNEFNHEDFKQMNNRMRGLPNQTIICIWNPIDELHWVKQDVLDNWNWKPYQLQDQDLSRFPESLHDYLGTDIIKIQTSQKNDKGNAVLLHTNYKDNWYISGHPDGKHGFIDQHQIDNFQHIRTTDPEWYNVYALGLWGRADRGSEFYKNFDSSRHVEPETKIYNDDSFPLHISFDENVNPFLTLTIWQAAGKAARLVDEITLPHPRNTLYDTLREFYRNYPPKKGNKRIYIYGDSTSRKADVKQEKGKDFYTIIEYTLGEYGYDCDRRVPAKNPNVATRGAFLNRVFSKRGLAGIDIKCSEKAKISIQDYMYLKEAEDGTKFKKMVKDDLTGVRYQERGHTSDANDYFLLEFFQNDYQEYLDGDKVEPPEIIPRVTKYVY